MIWCNFTSYTTSLLSLCILTTSRNITNQEASIPYIATLCLPEQISSPRLRPLRPPYNKTKTITLPASTLPNLSTWTSNRPFSALHRRDRMSLIQVLIFSTSLLLSRFWIFTFFGYCKCHHDYHVHYLFFLITRLGRWSQTEFLEYFRLLYLSCLCLCLCGWWREGGIGGGGET